MTEMHWTSPLTPIGGGAVINDRNGCAVVARYTSVEEEHRRLRAGIGLTDYSYFGKFSFTGPGALELANRVSLVDVVRLPINKIAPSFMLNPDGSVLCEAYVANRGDGYVLLTEGRNPEVVLECITEEAGRVEGRVEIEDLTRSTALIGLDGPFAWELAKEFFGMRILGVRYLDVVPGQRIDDIPVTVYRAGKTGEYGYWMQVEVERAVEVWDRLLEAGNEFDLEPSGYEAVDLCKLENRFVNMEREGAMASNVLELNTRILVDPEKGEYRGSDGVDDAVVTRRLIGLHVDAGSVAPAIGAEVQYQGTTIGAVANSGFSYTLGKTIAVVLMDEAYAYVGLDYDVRTEEGMCPAHTVSAPFVLNRSLTIRPQEHSYLDEK
jgi:glycine cleavage system aminomethyltransferase T